MEVRRDQLDVTLTLQAQDSDMMLKRSLQINLPGLWEPFTEFPTLGERQRYINTLLEQLEQSFATTVTQPAEPNN